MPKNLLINNDNVIALKQLQGKYRERVDVIYIDPPYNTGSLQFKYKDKMTHKEWKDFMEARLILAKDLLTDDGVIFISIDDNELYNLKILCDEIFKEENFITNFIWRKTGQQQNNGKNVSVVAEYILCYAKNLYSDGQKKSLFKKDNIKNRKGYAAYKHFDPDRNEYFRLNPIQDKTLGRHEYTLVNPRTNEEVHSKYWRITKDKYEALLKDNMIYWTAKLPNVKKYLQTEDSVLPNNIIDGIYNETGNKDLKAILGDNTFTNPKPVELIKKLIALYNKKDITVLDFFAGSGTTGQAVWELNVEDGGNRDFIRITNNENNICEEVTYKRLEVLIKSKFQNQAFTYISNGSKKKVGAEL